MINRLTIFVIFVRLVLCHVVCCFRVLKQLSAQRGSSHRNTSHVMLAIVLSEVVEPAWLLRSTLDASARSQAVCSMAVWGWLAVRQYTVHVSSGSRFRITIFKTI